MKNGLKAIVLALIATVMFSVMTVPMVKADVDGALPAEFIETVFVVDDNAYSTIPLTVGTNSLIAQTDTVNVYFDGTKITDTPDNIQNKLGYDTLLIELDDLRDKGVVPFGESADVYHVEVKTTDVVPVLVIDDYVTLIVVSEPDKDVCEGISQEIIDDVEIEDQEGDDELNPGDTATVTLELEGDGTRYEHLEFEATLMDVTDDVQLGRTIKTGDVGTLDKDEERTIALEIAIPEELNAEHAYQLVLKAESTTSYINPKQHGCLEMPYDLEIELPEDSLAIKDVTVSSGKVAPGSSFTLKARIYNNGENAQEEIKIKVEVPELGIKTEESLGTIYDDSDKLWTAAIGVPRDAKEGDYTLKISVESHDMKNAVVKTGSITVSKGASAVATVDGKIRAEDKSQDVGAKGGVFDLTILNSGSEKATFVIDVDGTSDWAKNVEITPRSIVTVEAGESKDVQVFVAPKDGVSGEKEFTVNIESVDGENVDSVELTANVESAGKTSVIPGFNINEGTIIKGLQWVFAILIVVAIVLFIVWLGRKGAKPEGEKNDKVYY